MKEKEEFKCFIVFITQVALTLNGIGAKKECWCVSTALSWMGDSWHTWAHVQKDHGSSCQQRSNHGVLCVCGQDQQSS